MSSRIAEEKKVVALMIRMYCRRHCRQQGRTAKADLTGLTGRTADTNQADRTGTRQNTRQICPECAALLNYALRRLDSCRFGNGKPSCRKCPVHCYRADMRERRHEGAHTHGHALGRTEDDIPPPHGRDEAPAARTPLPGTGRITLPCHYLPNYANFVKRQGRTSLAGTENEPQDDTRMNKRIIECVPNFSEGRDKEKIQQIVRAIEASGGVKVLDVDPGEATNRTVVTFVGEPEAVVEAAFAGVRKAAEVIDMRQHHGEHPRMGATDVLPLVPVSDITLEECVPLARDLARRIADELHIPTYCYEAAALRPERRNLAVCRAGEYEALPEKTAHEDTAPDFGARPYDDELASTGATAVGARDFLIAVNFNLNTTSTRRANAIAFDVREKGRPVREGNPITGPVVRDADGNPVMRPGTLPATKAIGWYIKEYGIAQVSMNLTDISRTPLHIAFDEVCRKADARGVRVTGTEIVGLVPKRALIDAGRHFLRKQHRSTGISEAETMKIAIKSMGLDDLKPFRPEEKVIEYLIEAEERKERLIDMSCKGFAEETASESPAPGGGSISAYMGALGAALGTMVANLSSHKAGWDERWEEFSDWADRGQKLLDRLLHLVDEDTEAFNRIMAVFAMPKNTDEEKAARSSALQEATLYATQVPLRTMKAAAGVFPVLKAMAETGNPNSVSDAGVGAIAVRGAVLGACLNVKINAAGLKDRALAESLVAEADAIAAEAVRLEAEILRIVEDKIKK